MVLLTLPKIDCKYEGLFLGCFIPSICIASPMAGPPSLRYCSFVGSSTIEKGDCSNFFNIALAILDVLNLHTNVRINLSMFAKRKKKCQLGFWQGLHWIHHRSIEGVLPPVSMKSFSQYNFYTVWGFSGYKICTSFIRFIPILFFEIYSKRNFFWITFFFHFLKKVMSSWHTMLHQCQVHGIEVPQVCAPQMCRGHLSLHDTITEPLAGRPMLCHYRRDSLTP